MSLTVEYGMVYDGAINRDDRLAVEAARRILLARARWHAKSNGITITNGPFFHLNALTWMDDPPHPRMASIAWSYEGVQDDS